MIPSPRTPFRESNSKERTTKKGVIAATLAAIAIAVTMPLTFAQTGGQGPGMMGSHGQGQGGCGPGMMMGGYGGHGMGSGMMGGYGEYGGNRMGPAMMYGYGGDIPEGLNLTDDQREKITKLHEALSTKRWELMGKMQEQQFEIRGLLASGNADDATIGKAYRNLEGLRRQMWASGADAQKQMDTVLTKSQREQLQQAWGRNAR